MPTYEYECTKGHTFEVVQRITEEPLKRCNVCRAKAHRLISAPRFILKGGGWYSDGYSSSGSGSTKKPGSGGDSGSTEGGGGKASSDTKTSSGTKASSGSDSAGSTTASS